MLHSDDVRNSVDFDTACEEIMKKFELNCLKLPDFIRIFS